MRAPHHRHCCDKVHKIFRHHGSDPGGSERPCTFRFLFLSAANRCMQWVLLTVKFFPFERSTNSKLTLWIPFAFFPFGIVFREQERATEIEDTLPTSGCPFSRWKQPNPSPTTHAKLFPSHTKNPQCIIVNTVSLFRCFRKNTQTLFTNKSKTIIHLGRRPRRRLRSRSPVFTPTRTGQDLFTDNFF